jgi:hypothetical protein
VVPPRLRAVPEGAELADVEEAEEKQRGHVRRAAGSREEEETDIGSSWSRGRRNRGGRAIPLSRNMSRNKGSFSFLLQLSASHLFRPN